MQVAEHERRRFAMHRGISKNWSIKTNLDSIGDRIALDKSFL